MRVLIVAMIFTGAAGAACLAIAAGQPSFVDASGFLVEPFAWMASGRLLLLASGLSCILVASIWTLRRMRIKFDFDNKTDSCP